MILLYQKNLTGSPSLSTGNATDSICPYGWQLVENDGSKSFSNLTNTYISRSTHTSFSNADTSLLTLSFLRSGHYAYDSGALNVRGTNGTHWSLRGYTSGTTLVANYLDFSSTYIAPQIGYGRGLGYALRCLAR